MRRERTALKHTHFLLFSSCMALASALADFSSFLAAESCSFFASICRNKGTKPLSAETATEEKCEGEGIKSAQGLEEDLLWPAGSAWTSQRFWAAPSGGYTGSQQHG